MPRPKTKQELLSQAQINFDQLWQTIDQMPTPLLSIEFDFTKDVKKTQAHWRRDKNIRDILVHLYEWHLLLQSWITQNLNQNHVSFLPAPYTWKTYAQLNQIFWEKHQNTSLELASENLKNSHQQSLALVDSLTDEQLFTKKYYDWTGTTSVGSYCISAMPSHYDWAIKKLKAHQKCHC